MPNLLTVKMFRYFVYWNLFHVTRLLQAVPHMPFKLWIWLMQQKLNSAKKMTKELETDWEKELQNIGC